MVDLDRLRDCLFNDTVMGKAAARNATAVFKAVMDFSFNGRCRATRAELADAALMSERSVRTHIDAMVEFGILVKSEEEGKGHFLALNEEHYLVQGNLPEKEAAKVAANPEKVAANPEKVAANPEKVAAYKEEEEEVYTDIGQVEGKLKESLELFNHFVLSYGSDRRYLAALLMHVDNEMVENWWIDRAIEDAISALTDTPLSYIKTCLRQWEMLGRPPDPKLPKNGKGGRSGPKSSGPWYSDDERDLFQR